GKPGGSHAHRPNARQPPARNHWLHALLPVPARGHRPRLRLIPKAPPTPERSYVISSHFLLAISVRPHAAAPKRSWTPCCPLLEGCGMTFATSSRRSSLRSER